MASWSTAQNSATAQPSVSQTPCSTWGAASAQVAALASGLVTANCTARKRSAMRRRLMSVTKATNSTGDPLRDVGETEISTGNSWPFRCRAQNSTCCPRILASPVSMNRLNPRWWSSRYRRGMMVAASVRPIASSCDQPKISSALRFQAVIRPASSAVMTALGEVSMMTWR